MPLAMSVLRKGATVETFWPRLLGDVAGAVRAGPEFGHGAHVALFGWRQTVEAHVKKARVEFGQRVDVGLARVGEVDRRFIGDVPTMLAPFLKKIGVAARLAQHLGDGVIGIGGALVGRRRGRKLRRADRLGRIQTTARRRIWLVSAWPQVLARRHRQPRCCILRSRGITATARSSDGWKRSATNSSSVDRVP